MPRLPGGIGPNCKAHFLSLPVKEYAGADGRASVTGEALLLALRASVQQKLGHGPWPVTRTRAIRNLRFDFARRWRTSRAMLSEAETMLTP